MIKSHDGYVFYENQRYIMKKDSKPREIFIWTPLLAARDDMVAYDPFDSNPNQRIQDPILAAITDPAEKFSAKMKIELGWSRDEVRAATANMNRKQKIIFALSIYWKLHTPVGDINSFAPTRGAIMRIIGPPLVQDDLDLSIKYFKTNPNNPQLLIQGLSDDTGQTFKPDIEPAGRYEGAVPMERRGTDGLSEPEAAGTGD